MFKAGDIVYYKEMEQSYIDKFMRGPSSGHQADLTINKAYVIRYYTGISVINILNDMGIDDYYPDLFFMSQKEYRNGIIDEIFK